MYKISYTLIGLALLGLCSCKNGGSDFRRLLRSAARDTGKSQTNTQPDSKSPDKKVKASKNEIKNCPEGARLQGAPPPSGTSQWCSLPSKDGKGVHHGEFIKWYDDGKTRTISFFEHGKAHGKYLEWHPNGQKKIQGAYIDNEKDGSWIEWDNQGAKQIQGTYKNGAPHGKFIYWSRKATIESEGTYIEGLKSGLWTKYNADGGIKSKISYLNGKKHGPSEIYTRKGELKQIESYFADVPHGKFATFWPDRTRKLEGLYYKGQKTGAWISYTRDGNIKETLVYKDGTATKISAVTQNKEETKRKTRSTSRRYKKFGKGDILGAEPPIREQQPAAEQTQQNKPSNLSNGGNWQSF